MYAMYLHLGQETVIRTSDIVGIFDIENTSIAKATKDFLKKAQTSGKVVNVTLELPKSYIVCADKTVYISQISPATLRKRSTFIDDLSTGD